jgi:site-specific DNA recombinase
VRLSREATPSNVSLQGMIDDLRALCAREGWQEVALHVDNGISGAVRDRPEFLAWLDDGRSGRAEILLTWHADRLTREGVNVAAMIMDLVEGKDGRTGKVVRPPVRLVDTRGLDSASGSDAWRLHFVLAAEIARAERQRMSDRARAAYRRLRTAGRYRGSIPPFGFRAVPLQTGGKALDIEPSEAELVREAARRILAGESLYRVTYWLNTTGVRPRRASSWTRSSVRHILTSDAVVGRSRMHGELVRDADGEPLQVAPPILGFADWQAVRSALMPSAPRQPGRQPTRLLGGLLACASCGRRLYVSMSRRFVYYRCPSRIQATPCSAPVVVSAAAIDRWIEEVFLSRYGRLPELERVMVADESTERVARLEDEQARILAELGKAATAELFERLRELQSELAAARSAASRARPRSAWRPTGRLLADAWEAASVDERRRILAAYLEPVLPLLVARSTRRNGFDPSRVSLDLDHLVDPFDLT